MADDKTPAEIEAARIAAEAEFDGMLLKRFGTTELIPKSEQTQVLTEDQKREAEEKRQSDILKFGLENNYISAKDQEEFIAATTGDKIDQARKKFIAANPNVKDAGKVFDRLSKIEEDDEIPDPKDQEKFIPNEDKKAAIAWAVKLADEDIDTRFARIKGLPQKWEQHQKLEKIKSTNSEVLKRAYATIPRRYEDEVEGVKFGIDFSDDDLKEAYSLAEPQITREGLTEDEAAKTMATFLFAKNAKRYVSEGVRLAYEKGRDDEKRGVKGLTEKTPEGSGGVSPKRAALEKSGVIEKEGKTQT